MKKLIAILLLATATQFSTAAFAHSDDRCSLSMLAGRWFFATSIGHQALVNAPPPGDITALGTMIIRRNGDVEGTFDVTFENAAFVEGVPYTGTITVNPDCTGTLSFVTGAGTSRTDTIAILDRYEFWGMSRDPKNVWTYTARRVSGKLGFSTR